MFLLSKSVCCRLRHSVPIVMEMWLSFSCREICVKAASVYQEASWRVAELPHPRLEGVLATLSLKLMLSFIPAVLLKLGLRRLT